MTLVIRFDDVRRADVGQVGGKNSSLGEMVQTLEPKGIRVPPGFATTAEAYWRFIEANDLKARISGLLDDHDRGEITLAEAGREIRETILKGKWPADTAEAIAAAYRELCERTGKADVDVAVRSSATAERRKGMASPAE